MKKQICFNKVGTVARCILSTASHADAANMLNPKAPQLYLGVIVIEDDTKKQTYRGCNPQTLA